MTEQQWKDELSRSLKVIFDAIPRGKKPFPIREASIIEHCARLGVKEAAQIDAQRSGESK